MTAEHDLGAPSSSSAHDETPEHDLGAPSSSSAPGRWRSRGYLPHFDAPGAVQFLTFRLHDSLPLDVLERLQRELASEPTRTRDATRRKRLDGLLDSGLGSCVLAHPGAAHRMEEALLHFDASRYQLLAWVVMPNHVHVLIEVLGLASLGGIVQSWK